MSVKVALESLRLCPPSVPFLSDLLVVPDFAMYSVCSIGTIGAHFFLSYSLKNDSPVYLSISNPNTVWSDTQDAKEKCSIVEQGN